MSATTAGPGSGAGVLGACALTEIDENTSRLHSRAFESFMAKTPECKAGGKQVPIRGLTLLGEILPDDRRKVILAQEGECIGNRKPTGDVSGSGTSTLGVDPLRLSSGDL